MNPSILAIATANPRHLYKQSDLADWFAANNGINTERSAKLRSIFAATEIERRYSVLPDFGPLNDKVLFDQYCLEQPPVPSARGELYSREAPKLAAQAAATALDAWAGERNRITHVISVSCTGFTAPGIEFLLIDELGLPRSVDRLGINFMGCFGAFRGVRAATAIAREDPQYRVLLVCTELCSIHLQHNLSNEAFISNALFGDGAAAVVIGCQPTGGLLEIYSFASMALPDSRDDITWNPGDSGYLMGLSRAVPEKIGAYIRKFVETLLPENVVVPDCDWAIHPGGKTILDTVGKALELTPRQLRASREILRNYGNMSSPTVLFILDWILRHQGGQWIAGIGFGPGISLEGVLMKRHATT